MKPIKLVYLRADLKETNVLLARIATALERAVGITPAIDPALPLEDAATYSAEADLIRAEFDRLHGMAANEDDARDP